MAKGFSLKVTLPNFFIGGISKAGTTTLYHYFVCHPEIYMSPIKETKFFNTTEEVELGLEYDKDFDKYVALFDGVKDEKVFGEATPGYLVSDLALERIQKHIDNPKFIFSLRNPIDRAFSSFAMRCAKGKNKASFMEEFLESQDLELKGLRRPNLYNRGVYAPRIKKYRDVFGKENVHVMIFERWTKNYVEELDGCFKFLGVSPLESIPLQHHFKGNYVYKAAFARLLEFCWRRLDVFDLQNFLRNTGVKDFVKYKICRPQTLPPLVGEDRVHVAQSYADSVAVLRDLLNDPIPEWTDDFPG